MLARRHPHGNGSLLTSEDRGGTITIGIISDTHGLLRPEAVAALAGVERIIHAGDVGKPEVLEALERIAPVEAVRGNVDSGAWAAALPATRTIELDGVRIYVLHSLAKLDFDPAARRYAAVISGHSHRPRREVRNGILYFNPGAAGPRRFRLPVSLGRLTISGGRIDANLISL